ncbi:MAG: PQQ-binding-like beta-propeller repeat protein [Candidatus Thermoplasmatota archaeon]|nr:PQQ-binding-like beta-propeller repeat protein [Candidatus Thermoplasmatota archaeon]
MKKISVIAFGVVLLLIGSNCIGLSKNSFSQSDVEGSKISTNRGKVEFVRENDSTGLADTPWPMFGGDLKHTGRSPYDTSYVDGTERWSFSTGWDINSSPAIGENGTIYVGSGDGNLYALYPNGTKKWAADTGGPRSSPAISSNGTIYIGSYNQYMHALHLNGTKKWSFYAGHSVYSSAAIGRNGTIYFGSGDGNLYALNPNGTEKWNFQTGHFINSSPAIGRNGIIYIGSWDDNLYAVYPNGTEKWRFSTQGDIHSSPSIASDGTIYVGSEDNRTYAINKNGTEKWNFTTGNYVQSSPSIGADGTIYVGSKDDNLYALNPNGTERWNFSTRGPVHSSPAISSDGTIYFGSFGERLYALNPDGTERWNFSTGYPMVSPAIGSDGTIYVGSHDDDLYAIRGPRSVEASGPDERRVVLTGNSTYDFSVENKGDVNDTYNLRVNSTDPNWTATVEEMISVAKGSSKTVKVTVRIPDTVSNGTSSEIKLTALSQNNSKISDRHSVKITFYRTKTEIDLVSSTASDGWNYLSTPYIPMRKNLRAILDNSSDGIRGNYDKVMYYEAKSEEWSTYKIGRSSHLNDLKKWDRSMGIWIHMTSNDTLNITGGPPLSTDIVLHPGWNMVGYPSQRRKIANATLPSEVTRIGIFNASKKYNIEYTSDLNDRMMSPKKGYWVYNQAEKAVTWTVRY